MIFHPATASPDSRSTASQIEFATGTDAEMAELNIQRDAFHGEWNYAIAPRQQAPP
jgi:hypothetical protein